MKDGCVWVSNSLSQHWFDLQSRTMIGFQDVLFISTRETTVLARANALGVLCVKLSKDRRSLSDVRQFC